jgi:hypothetical protein
MKICALAMKNCPWFKTRKLEGQGVPPTSDLKGCSMRKTTRLALLSRLLLLCFSIGGLALVVFGFHRSDEILVALELGGKEPVWKLKLRHGNDNPTYSLKSFFTLRNIGTLPVSCQAPSAGVNLGVWYRRPGETRYAMAFPPGSFLRPQVVDLMVLDEAKTEFSIILEPGTYELFYDYSVPSIGGREWHGRTRSAVLLVSVVKPLSARFRDFCKRFEQGMRFRVPVQE